jgi:hypothetical protein
MRSSGHLHLHCMSHLEYQICTIHTKHRWILFKLVFMSNCMFSQGPESSKWSCLRAPWALHVQSHKNLNWQVNDGWEHHEQSHVFHASTWIKWWSLRPIPSTKREGEEQQTNSKTVPFFRGRKLHYTGRGKEGALTFRICLDPLALLTLLFSKEMLCMCTLELIQFLFRRSYDPLLLCRPMTWSARQPFPWL